jgi:hypothetical protein
MSGQIAALGMCISYVEGLSLLANQTCCRSRRDAYLEIAEVRHGMGKHIWDIDLPRNFAPMMEVTPRPPPERYAGQTAYSPRIRHGGSRCSVTSSPWP